MSSTSRVKGPYVLGLDLGTSSIHCVLADGIGRPLAATSAPVSYFRPPGASPLAREFAPSLILDSLGAAVVGVLAESGVPGPQVSAIGVVSQRHGLVCLDADGQEVFCSPNLDVRAVFEGAAIDEELGPRIYRTTGHFPSILLAPARLQSLRNSQPERYREVDSVLSMAGWLACRLTESAKAEVALECESGLADVAARRRCPGLMDALQLPTSLLPPLTDPGEAAGALLAGPAQAWGMETGTPVFIAGPDTQCGLLGMGLTVPGEVGAVLGWSGALQALTSAPRFHDRMRTWVGCFPVEGPWVAESNLGDAGNAYRWLKDTLLGTFSTFDEAEALAEAASAAAEGVIALLGPGPIASVSAGLKRGGILFPTPLSFQETDRGQMLRAALESVAFSVKANLKTLLETAGFGVPALHVGGGMALSDTLAASLATTLDLPVVRPNFPHVSARGAAMLAATWSDHTSLEEAAETAARDRRHTEPGTPSEVAQYQEHYQEWLDLHRRLDWVHD